ncbi:MAG: redoxin domain-containing protein [Sumerlaeia bacterium]
MLRLFPTMLLCSTIFLTACNSQSENVNPIRQENSTPESASAEQTEDNRLQAGALKIGDKLPDFTLKTLEGESIQLSSLFDGESIVAVIWHSPACPCAANCLSAVREDLTSEKYKRLKILGVASDSQQATEWFTTDLQSQKESGMLTFPVVFDTDQAVMKAYGAKRTPTVYLADEQGILRFWGAPENTLFPGSEGHRSLITESVDAVLAKKTPDPQTYPSIGCLIE